MEVCKGLLDVNPLLAFRQVPLPVQNFRHILTNLVDVVLVGDEFVVHLLDEVGTAVAQLGQMQQCILDQMEAVDLVLHAHIKRRGDGAFLLVAVDTQVAVGALVGQLMHQRRVAVEREDDGLILGEQRVIIGIGQAVGVRVLLFTTALGKAAGQFRP